MERSDVEAAELEIVRAVQPRCRNFKLRISAFAATRLAAKLGGYWREVVFACRIGARMRDKLRLALEIFLFHTVNLLGGRAGRLINTGEVEFQIRLGARNQRIAMRRGSGDFFLFYEVLMQEVYLVPGILRDGIRRVIDLGANTGMTTLYYASHFPEASFVSVEPDAGNFLLLTRNVADIGPQVVVVEAAAHSQSGEADFLCGPTWGGRLREEALDGKCDAQAVRVKRVACVTVDQLLDRVKWESVDLLKIDIEGAEKVLLRQDAAWLSKVGIIQIELHGDYGEEDLRKDLAPYGFRIYCPGSYFGNRIILAISRARLSSLGSG